MMTLLILRLCLYVSFIGDLVDSSEGILKAPDALSCPSSGSFLPPKMSTAIARRMARCVGWNKPSIIWWTFFSELRKPDEQEEQPWARARLYVFAHGRRPP